MILSSQFSAELTTIATLALSFWLSVEMAKRYIEKKSPQLLFYSAGIWLYFIGVFIEFLFAFSFYSEYLLKLYLFIVPLVPEAIALGSISGIRSRKIRGIYYIYAFLTTLLLAYSVLSSEIWNMIEYYVVWLPPPMLIIIASSIITFPAAMIIVAAAALRYVENKSRKMISIIAGIIVISLGGTLYIIQYPALLYLSEFIGIALLFYGFV